MLTKWYFTIPLMIGIAQGCHTSKPVSETQKMTLPDESEQVIAAQNRFAFALFKDALQHDPSSANKLISPLSIYVDLSMAYNGAANETKQDMGKALNLRDINEDQLNAANQALIHNLPAADSSVTLDIANSIWYRDEGSQPLPAFLKTNSTYYNAQVAGADFSNPATVDEINNWVADHTNQKIKTILQRIDPADFMYLINAVYFKGEWKNSFDPEKTKHVCDVAFRTNRTEPICFFFK